MEAKKAPVSEKKSAAIKIAQESSKRKLQGKSPRVAGEERTEKAISWIYRWGVTSPATLHEALNSKSQITFRLVKAGLVNRTETPSGGINNTPSSLLTLTQTGLELAVETTDLLLPYEIDPEKINHAIINHSETVQRLTAYKLNNSDIIGFKNEKELITESGDSTLKQPDAMWLFYRDVRCAIELELTPKWDRELDRFIAMSLASLKKDEQGKSRFDELRIYSRSPALLKRYESHFRPGQKLQLWKKQTGKTGRWLKTEIVTIPNQNGKISFRLIGKGNSRESFSEDEELM